MNKRKGKDDKNQKNRAKQERGHFEPNATDRNQKKIFFSFEQRHLFSKILKTPNKNYHF